MGCCQSRRPITTKSNKIMENKKSLVDSATTVTRSQISAEQNEELKEYINNLKKVYSYEHYKSVWFNSCQEIGLYQDYCLETQQYSFSCTVIDTNLGRSPGFKFAIIAPELTELTSENIKNLVFVYCKEQRNTNDKVVPVVINIEKSRANKEEGSFQFIADLNGIVKLNIKIQIHSHLP